MSPTKTAKLKDVQAADVKSPDGLRRKLVKACRIRWLSHGEAVIAFKTELSSVCATLHYFPTEKKDCTAIGIFQLFCTKRFLISLYLLNAGLEHLNKLLMLFQKSSFNFSHIRSALATCKNEIRNLTVSNHVVNSLKLDWNKIAKILPSSQNDLLEDDIELIQVTTKTYCEALITDP